MKVYEGSNLKELKSKTRDELFPGAKQALLQQLCIQCKEPALPKCYSDAGRKEYRISGLCELCFDKIMGE